MRVWKKAVQALAGLALAFLAAVAAGTWLFPEENDLIVSLRGFRLSVSGLGAGLALLTVLAFADGWIFVGNKNAPEAAGPGRVGNGLGFGLLPGIAVWKIFEHSTALGRGKALPEGWSSLGFLSRDGAWLPSRAELMMVLLLFAAFALWLAVRKREIDENGDLFTVCAVCWAAVRLVTEDLRAEQLALFGDWRAVGWIFAGIMLSALILRSARDLRRGRNRGRVLGSVPLFLISVAGIVLIQNGVIHSSVLVMNLIAQILFAALAAAAVLLVGRAEGREA